MSEIDINGLVEQMRAMAAAAKGPPGTQTQHQGGPEFAALLEKSIEHVNAAQQEASKLAKAFEMGEPGIDLAQVMVAVQKASLSFEAMNQVRNRLVTAYQEVMRMPV